MRYARRKDRNQNLIVEALEQAGYSVHDLSAVGGGLTDILVGGVDRRDGQRKNWLIEVKYGRGKLNERQVEWHELWRGPKFVIRTVDEALTIVGVM